jgi:hypothetical protein
LRSIVADVRPGTLEDEGPNEDQKHNCRYAEQD